MRVLIDTNIFVFLVQDATALSKDVIDVLSDYSNTLHISTESVRELIVAFNNKGLLNKKWKTAKDMVNAIENEYYIKILPLGQEHMQTYADLTTNKAEGHNDPSDHVIISHAITNKMPLVSSDRRFSFYRKQGLELIFNER